MSDNFVKFLIFVSALSIIILEYDIFSYFQLYS